MWFPFAARGMLWGVEVGYHRAGARLAWVGWGACSGFPCARGCGGLGDGLTPCRCLTETPRGFAVTGFCPEAFSTLFFFFFWSYS